jgi:hypothetical protein
MSDSKWSARDIFYIFSREGIWLADETKAEEAKKKDEQYCGQIPVYNFLIYGRLIELERLLRKFTLYLIKAEHGLNWRALIPQEAEMRLEEEKSYRNIVESTSQNPVSFLELSELERVLLSESIWTKYLKEHFPKLEETKSAFRKLKAIRNKVAHARPCCANDSSVFSQCAQIVSDSVTGFTEGEKWVKPQVETDISDWDDAVHFDGLFETTVQVNQSHYRVCFNTIWDSALETGQMPPCFDIVSLIQRLCSIENYFTFLEITLGPPTEFAISCSGKIPARRLNWFLRTVANTVKSSMISGGGLILIPTEPMMPESMPEFCVPFSNTDFRAFEWLVWA